MDSDLKKAVEESLGLSRENNKILRRMQSNLRWGRAFRIFYWVIIIGSMLGTYYYFQPFFEDLLKRYNSVMSTFSQLQKTGSSTNDILNTLNADRKSTRLNS